MEILDPPGLLLDYRWVQENPQEPVPCPWQEEPLRNLRSFYKDNPRGFLEQMVRLETAYSAEKAEAAKRAGPAEPANLPKDEGTERIEEVIDRFIEDMKS
jgi:hypothetical protein